MTHANAWLRRRLVVLTMVVELLDFFLEVFVHSSPGGQVNKSWMPGLLSLLVQLAGSAYILLVYRIIGQGLR
jgi:hypothetical protein